MSERIEGARRELPWSQPTLSGTVTLPTVIHASRGQTAAPSDLRLLGDGGLADPAESDERRAVVARKVFMLDT